MTALSHALIAISILACGVVYGTDVFSAIVLRPALALVDDRTLVSTMGHVHDVADKRMPVPGVVGLMSAIAGTVVAAITGQPRRDGRRSVRGGFSVDLARYLCAVSDPAESPGSAGRCRDILTQDS